ncbi:MAG TPA: glycosyltransferase, partial [Candidatus Omnitrophota bacterium]|nr:glycosyltransferase [Candidatus Omnitrophota bacterium]
MTKRLSVLQVGKYYKPYIGGTENYLYNLVHELKKDLDVSVVVSNTRPVSQTSDDEGINVNKIARFGSIFSLPINITMPFWLKKIEADVLHFHLPNPLSVLFYLLVKPKGRVIVTYHCDICRQKVFNPLINPLIDLFLNNARKIIVSSPNIIENSILLRRYKEKCVVISFGIDIERFDPSPEILEKAKTIKNRYGQRLLLFVGRLVYYKGLEYLIKAMKSIDARLLIIGDGPLSSDLKKLAKKTGVEDKISWIGSLKNEDTAPYYHACEVFVLPSSDVSEGFGIVQLEAFACSKP